MKNLLILFVSVLALWSCDDRFDDLPNTAPELIINGKQFALAKDSVKTSLKHSNNPISFDINVNDLERTAVSVSANIVRGYGNLYVSGSLFNGGQLPMEGSNTGVTFEGTEDGISVLRITAKDEFGKETVSEIEFYVFQNIAPVGALTVTNTKIDGPYYIELDANGSYDQDAAQGGEIQAYSYTITGTNYNYEITTKSVKIPVNLPGPGGYQIVLEVVDNDGGKSTVTKNITL